VSKIENTKFRRTEYWNDGKMEEEHPWRVEQICNQIFKLFCFSHSSNIPAFHHSCLLHLEALIGRKGNDYGTFEEPGT
jgi:hypothetical protein